MAFIVALAGVGIGAFSIIATNIYVLPIARVYYEGSTYTITDGGGPKLFNYNQKSYDTHEAFDLTSDSYKIPETGVYQVTAQYSISSIDGGYFTIALYSNDIMVCRRSSTCSRVTSAFGVALVDILMFNKGDTLTIKVYQSDPGSASRNIFDGEEWTFFAIAKIA